MSKRNVEILCIVGSKWGYQSDYRMRKITKESYVKHLEISIEKAKAQIANDDYFIACVARWELEKEVLLQAN